MLVGLFMMCGRSPAESRFLSHCAARKHGVMTYSDAGSNEVGEDRWVKTVG
jgi:hypothetical protein